MQLRTLAAENAALKSANAEREQRSQLDLQDLRNFCLASQEKNMDKDSSIHAELQQHQQDLAGRMTELETVTQELSASKQHTSNRLDKVCSIFLHSTAHDKEYIPIWRPQGGLHVDLLIADSVLTMRKSMTLCTCGIATATTTMTSTWK